MKVLHNEILFEFVQETSAGSFDNKTSWGFEIKSAEKDLKYPRWATVVEIGPDVRAVQKHHYILIEHLMWTLPVFIGGRKVWKTDETKIIAISEEKPVGIV